MTDREKMIDLIINAKRTDPETGSFTEYLADFLLGYGVKLPTPQPGKPLTLDQLREMDGNPTWCEEVGKRALISVSDAGKWKDIPFTLFEKNDARFEWNIEGRELSLYSYPPAHIDRSEWEPCEFCGECEVGDNKIYPKNGFNFYAGFYKQTAVDEFNEEETEDVRYCPKCGRPLTEEAWAELEQRLRLPEPPEEG